MGRQKPSNNYRGPRGQQTDAHKRMDFLYASGDDEPACGTKRDKRLERNRESARKCRKKRKAYVSEMEEKVSTLSAENAALELENSRLQQLLRQLQTGATISIPDSSHKRIKSEFGVTMANDFSESAAGDI